MTTSGGRRSGRTPPPLVRQDRASPEVRKSPHVMARSEAYLAEPGECARAGGHEDRARRHGAGPRSEGDGSGRTAARSRQALAPDAHPVIRFRRSGPRDDDGPVRGALPGDQPGRIPGPAQRGDRDHPGRPGVVLARDFLQLARPPGRSSGTRSRSRARGATLSPSPRRGCAHDARRTIAVRGNCDRNAWAPDELSRAVASGEAKLGERGERWPATAKPGIEVRRFPAHRVLVKAIFLC